MHGLLCTKPLEAFPLLIDSLQGKVPSLASKLDGGQLTPLLISHGLEHFQLNWQAMTVPSWHITCPLALQQLILQDEVFEDLVQGVTCTSVGSQQGSVKLPILMGLDKVTCCRKMHLAKEQSLHC